MKFIVPFCFTLMLLVLGCDKDKQEARETPPEVLPSQSAIRNPQSAIVSGHLARITESKVLRIGIKADAPPFCFVDKDGNPNGFDVELGHRLARGLGVQPVFVTVTSAERIEKLKKGEIDVIIATMTATRKRAKEVDFSLPYFQDHQSLLVKADSPIQSYRDLAGKKVAAQEGTTSIENLKTVAPDAAVVKVRSIADGFAKLNEGEAEALTGDGLQLQALRTNAADPNQYRIAGEGFSVESYVIGLPQNDSEFRARIDDILTEIWTSGVWTRIFNKWLGPESKYNLEPQFQMPVLPP
ncbi:MAG TPA: transporter substrate-binding domain-containing protein [Planctomycetota bacterium]|nr:transporter substrate-binding domain-containing protein [Planctomycetota bacterium]